MGRPRPLFLLSLNLPPRPQSQALSLVSVLPYWTPVFPFPPVGEKTVHTGYNYLRVLQTRILSDGPQLS